MLDGLVRAYDDRFYVLYKVVLVVKKKKSYFLLACFTSPKGVRLDQWRVDVQPRIVDMTHM